MLTQYLFSGRKKMVLTLGLIAAPTMFTGCAEIGPGGAEAKIGVGPLKLYGVEAGPGGAEVKGPSAGPLKAFD